MYERFVSVLPLCAEVTVLSPRLATEMTRVLPQLKRPSVLPLISQDGLNGAAHDDAADSASVKFGFAARLEHLKGPLRLVEGFGLAHREWSSIELRIVGEGSQRQQVVQRLRELGLEKKSLFSGVYLTQEERNRFMRGVDVFVLPSLTEGTPNAIIEAMAHSKPIVATNVGGIPDVVSEEVGILVPPSDPKALGAAMSRLAGDGELRRRMGVAARKRYEQLFTPDAVLPLLMNFYERVVAEHHATGNGKNHLPDEAAAHPWSLS